MGIEFIKIGVIGGGKTGTPLIQKLLEYDFIKLIGVADVSLEAPGVLLAKDKDIFITQDYMEIANMDKKVDIIIDVSGDKEVREKIRIHFNETFNHHTILMPELIVVLMMSMAKGELIDTFHGYQVYN